MGLVYRKGDNLKFNVYSNADWGQKRPSQKSVSGNAVFCAGSMVSCKSQQESVVALSSKKVEFISLASCGQEVVRLEKFKPFLSKVLSKYLVNFLFDISVGEDNQACISDATNAAVSDHSKYAAIRYFFLVDNIENGNVQIHYVNTNDIVADVLTKNLSVQKFIRFVNLMGLA